MAIEIYQGKYVTAEPATNYIDTEAIIEGCKMLTSSAEDLTQTSKKIIDTKEYCSKDNFEIENATYDSIVNDCGTKLTKTNEHMQDLIEEILNATQKALDKKQLELNEIAKEKDMEMCKAEAINGNINQ